MVKVSNGFYSSHYWLEESRKRTSLRPIMEKTIVGKPIPYSPNTRLMLNCTMYWCRGFQRRNLRSLIKKMKSQNFDDMFVKNIILAWSKFKLLCAINPRRKMEYVWIFKHCLLPEQQEAFYEIRDCIFEDKITHVPSHIENLGRTADLDSWRVFKFWANEPMDLWIPKDCFPLVEVSTTSKLDYCFIPYLLTDEDKQIVRHKIMSYLYNLGVDELFIPPPDVLQKVGNQKYNDAGFVRYDHERPVYSFDSSFKMQKFLAQPLQPREVWLPGKAIKNNNNFFMNICRQLLKHDPVYPTPDLDVMWNRLKDLPTMLKFDISAFGLQYLREYLELGVQCIQELYPSSHLDEEASIFYEILSRTNIQLEDGTFVYPPRGIGLGYYEDLKTLVMLSLLTDYKLYSVYGDQGLIPLESFEVISTLQKHHFILKDEKIELLRTGESDTYRWGGVQWSPHGYIKPKEFLDPLFGAFFSRFHWERKLGLRGLSVAYPETYKRFNKRITFMYDLIHGYELYKGDSFASFDNAGVNLEAPVRNGYLRSWKVEHMIAPTTSTMFDVNYQTPFKPSRERKVPWKMGKDFSKLRKLTYKRSPLIDNSVYLYSNPRLEYNKKDIITEDRLLPVWADYLYLVSHGSSTGAIVSGLQGEEINLAINRQLFADDPFRARATGGYKVLTHWRSSRGPSEEWVIAGEILSSVVSRNLDHVKRADLRQNPSMMLDPLYYNSNLLQIMDTLPTSKKRKRDELSLPDSEDSNIARILEILPSKMSKGLISNFDDLVAEVRALNNDTEISSQIGDISDNGLLDEDDLYYAELVNEFDMDTF